MKILFLYSEIAGYFLAGLRHYVEVFGGEIHLVRWPVNPEAPFKFAPIAGVKVYERNEMSEIDLVQLAESLNPDLLYVTGWLDKSYLKVAKTMRSRGVKVVCALDNHWRGDLRQKIACLISPFFLKNRFSHIWVPGLYQYEFARRLGFPREKVLTGMYSADTPGFSKVFHEALSKKERNYPKTLLFVGRLVEVKGIKEMVRAFVQINQHFEKKWHLKIVGTGDLGEKELSGENVSIHDFVQPEELPGLASDAGAFILPSRSEPWGVVLHEFAAAGLPLIASNACGAATAFLKPGYNGFSHVAGDEGSILKALKSLMALSDSELLKMGKRSHQLSKQITAGTWAATLHQIARGGK